MKDYEDMTKDELQTQLEARGLPTSGNKDELVARLELNDEPPEAAEEAQAPSGQRDPDENPQPNAVAGQADEEDDIDPVSDFRTAKTKGGKSSGPRARIDEEWEPPTPRKVGRKRGQQDQFNYEILPDGRKREIIFE